MWGRWQWSSCITLLDSICPVSTCSVDILDCVCPSMLPDTTRCHCKCFILLVISCATKTNMFSSVQLFWPQGVTLMGSKRQMRSLMPAGSPISTSQTSTHGSWEKVRLWMTVKLKVISIVKLKTETEDVVSNSYRRVLDKEVVFTSLVSWSWGLVILQYLPWVNREMSSSKHLVWDLEPICEDDCFVAILDLKDSCRTDEIVWFLFIHLILQKNIHSMLYCSKIIKM